MKRIRTWLVFSSVVTQRRSNLNVSRIGFSDTAGMGIGSLLTWVVWLLFGSFESYTDGSYHYDIQ